MARKIKQGLDYFPHSCIYDNELKYLIALHKEKGYYIYFEILRNIYSDTGYFMKADKKYLVLFADEINADINLINDIINSCLDENLFHKGMFEQFQILTSNGIQERYFEAVSRRKEISLITDYILTDQENVNNKLKNVIINWLNVDKSTQSKVKESKVKEGEESKEQIETITSSTQVLKILNEIEKDKMNEMIQLTLFKGDLEELKQKFAVEFITRYGLNKTTIEVIEAFKSWMHKDKNFQKTKTPISAGPSKVDKLNEEKIKRIDEAKNKWNKIMLKISNIISRDKYENYLDLSILDYDKIKQILLIKASKKEIAENLDPDLLNPLLLEHFGNIELKLTYKQ